MKYDGRNPQQCFNFDKTSKVKSCNCMFLQSEEVVFLFVVAVFSIFCLKINSYAF